MIYQFWQVVGILFVWRTIEKYH